MFCFVKEHQGVCEGILFIDSTVLTVCHVKRASSHRTFKKQAQWGKPQLVGSLDLSST